MNMYVWENTDFACGSAWGGTICAIAENEEEARKSVRNAVIADLTLSGYADSTLLADPFFRNKLREYLESDLKKEPVVKNIHISRGGDL